MFGQDPSLLSTADALTAMEENAVETLFQGAVGRDAIGQRFRACHRRLAALQATALESASQSTTAPSSKLGTVSTEQRYASVIARLNAAYEAALSGSRSADAGNNSGIARPQPSMSSISSSGRSRGGNSTTTALVLASPPVGGGEALIPLHLQQDSQRSTGGGAAPPSCFDDMFSAKNSIWSVDLDRVVELFSAHVMSEKRNGVLLKHDCTTALNDAAGAVKEVLKEVLWFPERRCAVILCATTTTASSDSDGIDDVDGGTSLIATLVTPTAVRQQRKDAASEKKNRHLDVNWNLDDLLAFCEDGACSPQTQMFHIPLASAARFEVLLRSKVSEHDRDWRKQHRLLYTPSIVVASILAVCTDLTGPHTAASAPTIARGDGLPSAQSVVLDDSHFPALGYHKHSMCVVWPLFSTLVHFVIRSRRLASRLLATFLIKDLFHDIKNFLQDARAAVGTAPSGDGKASSSSSSPPKPNHHSEPKPAATPTLFTAFSSDPSANRQRSRQPTTDCDAMFKIRQGLRDRQSALERLCGWLGSCILADVGTHAHDPSIASGSSSVVGEVCGTAVMSTIKASRQLLREAEDVTSLALQPGLFNTQLARVCRLSDGARLHNALFANPSTSSQGGNEIAFLLSAQRMKMPSMVARPAGLASNEGYKAWGGSTREPQAVLFELERLAFDLFREMIDELDEDSDSDEWENDNGALDDGSASDDTDGGSDGKAAINSSSSTAAFNLSVGELFERWDEYDKYTDLLIEKATGATATHQGPWTGLCQLESRRRIVAILFALYAELKMQRALSSSSGVDAFTTLPAASILTFLDQWVVDTQSSVHCIASALRACLKKRFATRQVVWKDVVAFGDALSHDPTMQDVVRRQVLMAADINAKADAAYRSAQAVRAEWENLKRKRNELLAEGCDSCVTEAEEAHAQAVVAAAEKTEHLRWVAQHQSNYNRKGRGAAPVVPVVADVTWESCYTFKQCTACTQLLQRIALLEQLKSPVFHLPLESRAVAALYWPPVGVVGAMCASARVTSLLAGTNHTRAPDCQRNQCRFVSDKWWTDARQCPSYVPPTCWTSAMGGFANSFGGGSIQQHQCHVHFHEATSKPELQTISVKQAKDLLRIGRSTSGGGGPIHCSVGDKAMPCSALDVSKLRVHPSIGGGTFHGAYHANDSVPSWLDEHPEPHPIPSTTTRGNIGYTCSATNTRTLLSIGRETMSIVGSLRAFGGTQHRLALQALLGGAVDGRKLESSAELRRVFMLSGAHVRGLGGQDHLCCLRQLHNAAVCWIDQVTLPNALALVCVAQQYGTLAVSGRPRDAKMALNVVSRAVAQAARLSQHLTDSSSGSVGSGKKTSREMWALVERVSAIAVACCAFLPERRCIAAGPATALSASTPPSTAPTLPCVSHSTAEAYCVSLLRMRRAFVLSGKHHPTTVHLEAFLDAARYCALEWLPSAIAAADDPASWQRTLFHRVVASIDPTASSASSSATSAATESLWTRDSTVLHVYTGAVARSCGTRSTTYQINAWSGEVFVNGSSLLGLPDTFRHRETFRELFGDLNFEVCVAEEENTATTATTANKTTTSTASATSQQQPPSSQHAGYRTVSNFVESVHPQLQRQGGDAPAAAAADASDDAHRRRDITFTFLWSGSILMEERGSGSAVTARQYRHCDDPCVNICGRDYIPWRTKLVGTGGEGGRGSNEFVVYRPKPSLPGAPWLGSVDAGKVRYVGVVTTRGDAAKRTTHETIREVPEVHQQDVVAELLLSNDLLACCNIVAKTAPPLAALFAAFEPVASYVSHILEPVVGHSNCSTLQPQQPQLQSQQQPADGGHNMRAKITLERFAISFVATTAAAPTTPDGSSSSSFVWLDDADYEISASQSVAWLPCSQNHLRLTLRAPTASEPAAAPAGTDAIAPTEGSTARSHLRHRLKPSEVILLPVGCLAQGKGAIKLPGVEKGLHRLQYIKVHRHDHFGYIECDTISGRLYLAALLTSCDSGIVHRSAAGATALRPVVEHIVMLLRRCMGNRPWSQEDRRSMEQVRRHPDPCVFLLGAAMEAAATQVSFLPHDDAQRQTDANRVDAQAATTGNVFEHGEALNRAMNAYRSDIRTGRVHPSCILDEAELRLALRIPVQASSQVAQRRPHCAPSLSANPADRLLADMTCQTRPLHALLRWGEENEAPPGSDVFVLQLCNRFVSHEVATSALCAVSARRDTIAALLHSMLSKPNPEGTPNNDHRSSTSGSGRAGVLDPLPIKSSEVVDNAQIAPGLAEAFFTSIEASWMKGQQLGLHEQFTDPTAVANAREAVLSSLAECAMARTRLREMLMRVNEDLFVATRNGVPHPALGLIDWLQESGGIGTFALHDVGKLLVATSSAPSSGSQHSRGGGDGPMAMLPLMQYLAPSAAQRLRQVCHAYTVVCTEWDSLLRLRDLVEPLFAASRDKPQDNAPSLPVDVGNVRVPILNEITSPRAAIEQMPAWLVMEAEQRIRIRKAQYDTWKMLASAPAAAASSFTTRDGEAAPSHQQPCGLVTQLNMGEGKTRVIIPMLMLSELEHGRSVCVHALSSVVGEYTEFYENCMSSPGLGVRLMHFPFNRDVTINARHCRQMVQSLRNFTRMAVLVVREHFASFIEKHEELWLADHPQTQLGSTPAPATANNASAPAFANTTTSLAFAAVQPATAPAAPPGATATPKAVMLSRCLPSVTELFGSSTETLHVFDEVDELLRYDFGLVYANGYQQKLPSVTMRGELLTAVLTVVAEVTSEWKQCGKTGRMFSWGSDAPQGVHADGEFPPMHLVLQATERSSRADGSLSSDDGDDTSDAFLKEILERLLSKPPRCSSWMRALPKAFLMQVVMDPADVDLHALPDVVSLEDHAEQLMLIRGLALHRILLFALSRRPQETYGVPPMWRDTRLAVPYEAADVPTKRSEFAQADVSLLLTLLAYCHRGLTMEQFSSALRYLAAMPAAARRMEVAAWLPLVDASFPIDGDVDVNNDVCVALYFQQLHRKIPVVSFWVRYCVFEVECRQFPSMLVASAWDVGRVPRSVGFSGTSDARWLLPESVRLEDHPDRAISAATGVMMRLLMDHTLGNVEPMDDRRGIGRPLAILHRALELGCRAVIDVGAAFAGKRMGALARSVLPLLPSDMNGVCFFDVDEGAQGHWVILEKKTQAVTTMRQSALTASHCFVLFDQARCRGSDHKLRPDTVALVTLGVDTTKDSLMQAVGRLRQFGRAQKIRLVAPPEVMPQLLRCSGSSKATNASAVDVLRWLVTNTLVRLSNGLPSFVFASAHHARKVTKLREANVGAIPIPHETTASKMYACGTSMQPLQTLVDRAGCTYEVRQRMQDLGSATHVYRSSAGGAGAQQTTEREVSRETQQEDQYQVHYLVRQPAAEGPCQMLLDTLNRVCCASDYLHRACLPLDKVLAAYLGPYVSVPAGMHVSLKFGTVFTDAATAAAAAAAAQQPTTKTTSASANNTNRNDIQLNAVATPLVSSQLRPLPAIVRRVETVVVFCETRQVVLLSHREAADVLEACATLYGCTAVHVLHLAPDFGGVAFVLVHDVPLEHYDGLADDTESIASIDLSESGASSCDAAGSELDEDDDYAASKEATDVTQRALRRWAGCVREALATSGSSATTTTTDDALHQWMRSVVCFVMLFNGWSVFPRQLHSTLKAMLKLPFPPASKAPGGASKTGGWGQGLDIAQRADGLKTAASSFLSARELIAEYLPSSDLEAIIKESISQHAVLADQNWDSRKMDEAGSPPPQSAGKPPAAPRAAPTPVAKPHTPAAPVVPSSVPTSAQEDIGAARPQTATTTASATVRDMPSQPTTIGNANVRNVVASVFIDPVVPMTVFEGLLPPRFPTATPPPPPPSAYAAFPWPALPKDSPPPAPTANSSALLQPNNGHHLQSSNPPDTTPSHSHSRLRKHKYGNYRY